MNVVTMDKSMDQHNFLFPSILFTFGRMRQGTIWPKFIFFNKFHWTASKN